jgi:hypothetical protein
MDAQPDVPSVDTEEEQKNAQPGEVQKADELLQEAEKLAEEESNK